MKKKVLITGSSGYIGSHLCRFLEDKYDVYGLDFVDPKIETTNFLNMDIRMNISLAAEFDTIVHLAGLVNVRESVYKPINYFNTNVNGTNNILSGTKCNNFILASTGAAVEMESPYGISKRMAEECVKQYCNSHNMDYTIFRFYNVIGSTVVKPTNPDGLFYNLLNAPNEGQFTIFGKDYKTKDGTCVRDYIHVNEVCQAIEYAIDKPTKEVENLGHGEGHTVLEMVNLFKEINNVEFETVFGSRRPGDIEASVLQNPSKYMVKLYQMKDLLKFDK